MTEEPLAGGNMTDAVVRIGDRVHRTRGPRAEFAAKLLTYLEEAEYPYAPRYLGIDDQGREMLTYIPGSTSDHPAQRDPDAWRVAGGMLRTLHDITADCPLAQDSECVNHRDPGPFNTIFRTGTPIAFIDWDSAGPGTRRSDLAYLAWTWCIYPDRAIAIADQAGYLRAVRTGYGEITATELIDEIVAVQTALETQEAALAADDHVAAARRRHARRAADWAASCRAVVEQHRSRMLQ